MSKSSPKSSSTLRRVVIIAAAVVLVCAILAGVAEWLVVPGVANKLVRHKLDAAESKLGLDISTDEVATAGVSAVAIRGLKIVDPTSGQPVAEIGSISTSVDAVKLLLGHRELSSIVIKNATLHVRRNADGSTNLESILARAHKKTGGAHAAPGSAPTASGSRAKRFLRFFGGEWPDVEVHNARVELTAAKGAKPWPIDAIATKALTLDSKGDAAKLATSLQLSRGKAHPRWAIPKTVDLAATLRLPLTKSTGEVTLGSPLQVVGVGPYPFLRLGIGGVSIDSGNTVSLQQLSLGVQADAAATHVASVKKVSATFSTLKPSLEALRPLDVTIEQPVLSVDYDAQEGSGLNDLLQLMRAPIARHVHGKAAHILREIAQDKGIDYDKSKKKGGGLLAKLGKINWSKFLADQAPQTVTIDDAAIEVTDHRHLPLETMDAKASLRDGHFKFSHRAINGQLVFSGGFTAQANGGEPRGKVDAKLTWSYRDHGMKLHAKVDSLSLPWVVQVFDGGLADKVRGGVLRVDLDAERPDKKTRTDINGLVSVEDASFFLAPVTEEPVEKLTASYAFDAHYNPHETVPEPQLLDERAVATTAPPKTKDDDPRKDDAPDKPVDDAPPKPKPPKRGGLVVSRGHFEVNGVAGEFRPALYGLAGFKKRPARFDVDVELPKVGVSKLFAAIPDAIKGPLVGTRMKGSFAWTLHAEVPLYHAGDMEWDSKPQLQNFELVSMPDEVDVRKLRDQFQLTINDPVLKWKRTVTIPAMRPVPLDWLSRHSGIPVEEFEKRRKKREWPPRYAKGFDPDPDHDGIPNRLLPYPPPWPTDEHSGEPTLASTNALDAGGAGTTRAAPKPYYEPLRPIKKKPPRDKTPLLKTRDRRGAKIPKDVTVYIDGKKKRHPYGPYTFVPLQYISPWMLRAAMTTEDNSFFEHHGFNWYALKDSVEDNLAAGHFVRGASTISMQLVKNVFLNRKKVLARKLQEAFLVWLMEDVVDIPKARILELYFNIIEYGPGIFGVSDAAMHYFGKRPDQLTLTEVAWLVSIVPNPKKYHIYYERGKITDAWFRHMLRYIKVMQNRGRVTDVEYELAKTQKPEFYKPNDGDPMLRIERKPSDLEQLKDEAESIEIPGLKGLFSP